MDKLRESSSDVINKIQSFVSEFIKEKQILAEEAKRLAEYDNDLKAREVAVSSVEKSEATNAAQEDRKTQLLKLQSDISRDFEANDRERKLLAEEKAKWLKQKEADEKGIANERQEIRNQNAALAKEKAEYKDKVLKKLKAEV